MDISSSSSSLYQQDPRNQAGAIDTQNQGLKSEVPGATGGTVTIRSVDASNNAEQASDAVARGEESDRVSRAKSGAQADETQGGEDSRKTETRNGKDLTPEEAQMVDELVDRDREVRAHEQAHAAAGGQYAGSPTYSFQRGPDGQSYAIGGEVSIDTSPIPGDPQATMQKMRTVIAAANAPAEPSGQDRKVASQAQATITDAAAELVQMRQQEQLEETGQSDASDAETEATAGSAAVTDEDGTARSAGQGDKAAAEHDESRTEAQSNMNRRLVDIGAIEGQDKGTIFNNLA